MEDPQLQESLEVAALTWLFESEWMGRIEDKCLEYGTQEKKNAVFRFVIEVDPFDLLEFDALLGSELLHRPRSAWKVFQQVCFTAISEQRLLHSLQSISQLLLVLRLTSPPLLPSYRLDHTADLPPISAEPRFLCVSGVVVSASLPEQYTQSATFSCPSKSCCQESSGSAPRLIRLHIAGASEADTTRNNFTCPKCQTPLTEEVSLRTLGAKLLIDLVPLGALQVSRQRRPSKILLKRHQAITVILRDELCSVPCVELGREVCVVGIPVHELSVEPATRMEVSVLVEANNVFPGSESSVGRPFALAEEEGGSMEHILQACQYSPWAFTASLAYSFAAHHTPPGTYHKLKLAMLLSLVNCSDNSKLNMLCVSSGAARPFQLLSYGSSFAPRCIVHTSTGELYGSVRKDGSSVFIDGGGLVLAEGGVCLLGNLSHLKKESRDKLQNTLETGAITLPLPRRHSSEEALQHVSWPLGCSVWCCYDALHRSKAFTKADPDVIRSHSLTETTNVSRALADQMELLLMVDPPTQENGDYVDELLSEQLLERAVGTSHQPPLLADVDFRHMLEAARPIKVSVSPQARGLLKAFYLASRRARASAAHGTDVAVSALDRLTSVAVAHAKLSLRTEVVEEDAVLAIVLYEESMVARFGHSVIQLLPSPHFRDGNVESYLGHEFHQNMRKLHQQIRQFCTLHAPSVVSCEE